MGTIYAMLYAIFALFVPHGFEKGVDKDHIAIALFDEKFVNSNIIPKDMSRLLHGACDLRQAYDFQPFFEVGREEAMSVLDSADKFVKAITEKLLE